MKIQSSGDARLLANSLATEMADRGLFADPQLQGLTKALLEKLGFDPAWATELVENGVGRSGQAARVGNGASDGL